MAWLPFRACQTCEARLGHVLTAVVLIRARGWFMCAISTPPPSAPTGFVFVVVPNFKARFAFPIALFLRPVGRFFVRGIIAEFR